MVEWSVDCQCLFYLAVNVWFISCLVIVDLTVGLLVGECVFLMYVFVVFVPSVVGRMCCGLIFVCCVWIVVY